MASASMVQAIVQVQYKQYTSAGTQPVRAGCVASASAVRAGCVCYTSDSTSDSTSTVRAGCRLGAGWVRGQCESITSLALPVYRTRSACVCHDCTMPVPRGAYVARVPYGTRSASCYAIVQGAPRFVHYYMCQATRNA